MKTEILIFVLTSRQLQYPGIWQHPYMEIVDFQLRIAKDLQRRKYSLRDADGYIHEVARSTQARVKKWTHFPEDTLELGQLKTYIINCPELHPLTSQILEPVLESRGCELAAEVRLININPRPYNGNFSISG